MDIKDFEQLMIRYGLVIRAIPDKKNSFRVAAVPSGGRSITAAKQPLETGIFLVESDSGTDPAVLFSGRHLYHSLEELVKDLSSSSNSTEQEEQKSK